MIKYFNFDIPLMAFMVDFKSWKPCSQVRFPRLAGGQETHIIYPCGDATPLVDEDMAEETLWKYSESDVTSQGHWVSLWAAVSSKTLVINSTTKYCIQACLYYQSLMCPL